MDLPFTLRKGSKLVFEFSDLGQDNLALVRVIIGVRGILNGVFCSRFDILGLSL